MIALKSKLLEVAVNNIVKIGVIGLGVRGMGLLKGILLQMEDVEVAAVCDLYEDRRNDAALLIQTEKGKSSVVAAHYSRNRLWHSFWSIGIASFSSSQRSL